MWLPIAGVEWDDGNLSKCQKHGLSVAEIEELLQRDDVTIVADFKHSGRQEQRMVVVGLVDNRWLFVGFTLRSREGGIFVRPISARYMREKEAQKYA